LKPLLSEKTKPVLVKEESKSGVKPKKMNSVSSDIALTKIGEGLEPSPEKPAGAGKKKKKKKEVVVEVKPQRIVFNVFNT